MRARLRPMPRLAPVMRTVDTGTPSAGGRRTTPAGAAVPRRVAAWTGADPARMGGLRRRSPGAAVLGAPRHRVGGARPRTLAHAGLRSLWVARRRRWGLVGRGPPEYPHRGSSLAMASLQGGRFQHRGVAYPGLTGGRWVRAAPPGSRVAGARGPAVGWRQWVGGSGFATAGAGRVAVGVGPPGRPNGHAVGIALRGRFAALIPSLGEALLYDRIRRAVDRSETNTDPALVRPGDATRRVTSALATASEGLPARLVLSEGGAETTECLGGVG